MIRDRYLPDRILETPYFSNWESYSDITVLMNIELIARQVYCI